MLRSSTDVKLVKPQQIVFSQEFMQALGVTDVKSFKTDMERSESGDYFRNISGCAVYKAVKEEDISRLKTLLTHGAEPDLEVSCGVADRITPLYFAANMGHFQMAELLMMYGANPFKSTSHVLKVIPSEQPGISPMYVMSRSSPFEIAKIKGHRDIEKMMSPEKKISRQLTLFTETHPSSHKHAASSSAGAIESSLKKRKKRPQ